MKNIFVRLVLAGVAFLLLTSAYNRLNTPGIMTGAANAFLASLSADQRAKATFQFTDDERLNWHFIPKVRKGLPLREMSPAQRHLAEALLSAGMSQRGYIKATSIMSLEAILKELEKDNPKAPARDPEGYFFSVFGEPSEKATWGYRVEGHHFATNFTIVNGKVTGSPNFFGSNPAEVKQGPRKGLRVLAAEEDLGRDVLVSLTADQKKTAVVAAEAYKDILTAANRKAAIEGQPSGLSASKMTAKQRELLNRLLEEYAYNLPDQVAQARMEMIKKAGTNMFFAWAGVEQKGGPHYYRVQGPTFLVEYDNTQNDANHVHSVWRDLNGDFGLDMLGDHIKTSHR